MWRNKWLCSVEHGSSNNTVRSNEEYSFIIERLARKQDKTSWQSPVSSFWIVTDYKPLSFSFKIEGICFLKYDKPSTLVPIQNVLAVVAIHFIQGYLCFVLFACIYFYLFSTMVSLSTNIRRNCAPQSHRRALLSFLGFSAFTAMTASWPPSKESRIFLVVLTKAT